MWIILFTAKLLLKHLLDWVGLDWVGLHKRVFSYKKN